ncbi:MAG: alpha/beta fold hydrolase, partial [Pseudomonadota bacterium]
MIWDDRPRTDFGRLRAVRSGEGPRLLLLHGVGLRAEAWNRQIDGMSETFEVIAPDMPGHGHSSFDGVAEILSAYTDRIAEAIDEPIFVAGHSMGALIALDLAIRYPQRVAAVAGLNMIFRRSLEAAQAVQARASDLSMSKHADPNPTLLRWFGDLDLPEAKACRRWLSTVNPGAYKQAY